MRRRQDMLTSQCMGGWAAVTFPLGSLLRSLHILPTAPQEHSLGPQGRKLEAESIEGGVWLPGHLLCVLHPLQLKMSGELLPSLTVVTTL